MSEGVDIDRFCAILEKHKERTRRQLQQFIIIFVITCCENVIVGGEFGPGTPVDTGFLRAMWWLSIGGSGSSPPLSRPTERTDNGPSLFGLNSTPMEDAVSILVGDSVSLNNNTEYAPYVENGTASMEPRAMVRTVANAAQAIAQKCARDMGWSGTDGLSVETV